MNTPVLSKITDGAAFGIPAGIIISWLIKLNGIEVPPEVSTAIGGLLTTLVAYYRTERRAHIGVRG